MSSLIDSDKLQGIIRNPFAFCFPIQRGFSGSIQTLPFELKHRRESAVFTVTACEALHPQKRIIAMPRAVPVIVAVMTRSRIIA
jgi:hypothetical protein